MILHFLTRYLTKERFSSHHFTKCGLLAFLHRRETRKISAFFARIVVSNFFYSSKVI